MEDVGYLTDPSQLRFLPNSVQGIRLLQEQFLIIIVTNQSAVGRGLLSREKLLDAHRSLAKLLHNRGALLDAIYVCPHHPQDRCRCRKPEPGMLFRARDDFDISLASSFMVGDKHSDVLAGKRAGVAATILIPSYQTEPSLDPEVTPDYMASALCDAAKWILGHRSKANREGTIPDS